MAEFQNQSLTRLGRNAIAQAVAGETLEFTKIQFGDGYMPSSKTVEDMTALVSPKDTFDITKCVPNGNNTVTVTGVFTNANVSEGYYWREIGLFAKDPADSTKEILYAYGNAADLADYIPSSTEATVYEKIMDVVTYIGEAANVTVTIPLTSYISLEDLLDIYPVGREIATSVEFNPAQAIGGTWEHVTDYHGFRKMHYYRRTA